MKSKPEGKKTTSSGISYLVSDADFDAPKKQMEDAIMYLIKNKKSIQRLVDATGVEDAVLDFGISFRDVYVQCDRYPSRLIKLAADCNLAIEHSLYPVSTKEKSEPSAASNRNLRSR